MVLSMAVPVVVGRGLDRPLEQEQQAKAMTAALAPTTTTTEVEAVVLVQ